MHGQKVNPVQGRSLHICMYKHRPQSSTFIFIYTYDNNHIGQSDRPSKELGVSGALVVLPGVNINAPRCQYQFDGGIFSYQNMTGRGGTGTAFKSIRPSPLPFHFYVWGNKTK